MQANRTTNKSDAPEPTSSTGADWDPYNVWRNSIQESQDIVAPPPDIETDEGWSPYKVWESLIKE